MARAVRPFGLFRNLSAKIAAIPMVLTVIVVFVGCTLWTVIYSFTELEIASKHAFRRPCAISTSVDDGSLEHLDRQSRHLRHPRADLRFRGQLLSCRVDGSEDPVRKYVSYHLSLSLRSVLHRHWTCMAMDPRSQSRLARRTAAGYGLCGRQFRSAWQPGNGDLRAGDRRPLARAPVSSWC